jgi:hypothetical protein
MPTRKSEQIRTVSALRCAFKFELTGQGHKTNLTCTVFESVVEYLGTTVR